MPLSDPIRRLQEAMKQSSLKAVVIEPGPALDSLTGVRWGRSERTFALVVPVAGDPVYVLPAFEERRARERVGPNGTVRLWQEDESPFALIAHVLAEWKISAGRIGLDDSLRFFVYDGIRKAAPQFEYVSASGTLKAAGK